MKINFETLFTSIVASLKLSLHRDRKKNSNTQMVVIV